MNIKREQFLNDLEMVKAGLSPREFIEQSSCLVADTVIHTLGGDFTIRELLRQGKTEFSVYSTDGEKLRIGKAHSLRKTRKNAKVVLVVFDTGHTIKLTSDHLVMMRDGTYLPAGDLKKGFSVMPFNHSFSGGYYWIFDHIDIGRQRAHVWAYTESSGTPPEQEHHVHHVDGNTWNNDPSNLQSLHKKVHCALHTKTNPPARMPHVRKMLSEKMKGNKCGAGPKPGTAFAMLGNQNARGKHKRPLVNHKVVSVEEAGREDVFDLSVEKFHNFAANGIFVHNCFVFQNKMVMTFNDEVACRKDVGLDITGAIQATSLLDILGKLNDPDLKVRENEKGELEFLGKRKRFGVTKDAEIFLPIDRVEMPEKWRPLPKEFTEAVSLVQHCVSTDESRFLLCCIHLHPEYIEACDNLQIMRVKVDTGLKNSVLVRGTSLRHVVSLGMDKVALTKSWIHFKNQDGLIFSCRRYTEEYPSLDPMMSVKGHDIVIPKGLMEASDRAAVFASDKSGDPLISVSLMNGIIIIVGEGLSGWYKEKKKVAYEGPPMNFVIAPDLLKHISDKYQEAHIGESKLKVAGGHWEYVTVLGKPTEEVVEADEEETEEPAPKKKKKSSDE